jgi:Arc/MetJ family transcription regulator
MRINIEIDDQLMRDAMRVAGTQTKRAAVENALKLLVRLNKQEGIRRFRGKIKWQGNLSAHGRAAFESC